MRHHSRSRRQFLKLMGSAGAMAGFSRLLWPQVAEAAGPAPLRFCGIMSPHGLVPETWAPQGGETDFNIAFDGCVLKPFDVHRAKLLVLTGLDYRVLYEYGTTGHEGGPVAFLTGSKRDTRNGEYYPNSASIDQFLADKLGSQTRFRSVALNVYEQFGAQHVYNTISFTSTGDRVPWERSPKAFFNRIFAGLTGGMASQADLRALERRKSLLDYLVKDATRLQTKLAGPEQQKLNLHLDALRDIERRINSMSLVTCSKPATPAEGSLSDANNIPTLAQLHFDLLAQAFACDLTRFATVMMTSYPMPFLGVTENVHDDLAHRIDVTDPTERTRVRTTLSKCHTWYAQQVANFATKLNGFNEGGGTVLDHSLILYGNELGNPSGHSNLGVPTVVVGGVNGKWRMGRYLKLRTTSDQQALGNWSGSGQKAPNTIAHNKLLVSIAQAFEQDVTTFGQADYMGPMTGLV